MSNLYSTFSEAQAALANKKVKLFTSWRIRQNENNWFYLQKIVVSQDVAGNLKVNGKRVGELINGLFREGCDDLNSWSKTSKDRFMERCIQFEKELEGRAIVAAANSTNMQSYGR